MTDANHTGIKVSVVIFCKTATAIGTVPFFDISNCYTSSGVTGYACLRKQGVHFPRSSHGIAFCECSPRLSCGLAQCHIQDREKYMASNAPDVRLATDSDLDEILSWLQLEDAQRLEGCFWCNRMEIQSSQKAGKLGRRWRSQRCASVC